MTHDAKEIEEIQVKDDHTALFGSSFRIEYSFVLFSQRASKGTSRGWSSFVLSSLPLLLGFLLPCLPLPVPPIRPSFSHAAFYCSFSPANQEIPPRIEDARALLPTKRRRQPRARTWLVARDDSGTVRYPVPAIALSLSFFSLALERMMNTVSRDDTTG